MAGRVHLPAVARGRSHPRPLPRTRPIETGGRRAARPARAASRPSHTPPTLSQVNDALAAAEALLAAANGGTAPAAGAPPPPESPFAAGDVELRCDVNGCSIVPVAAGAAAPAGPGGSLMASLSSLDEDGHPAGPPSAAVPKDFQLAEGPGWRLGVDLGAAPGSAAYAAVVGGDGWSAALTRDEYDDLVRLIANLRESVATLHVCGDWGAAGDDAALEMSTPRVWAQGRAPADRLGSLQAAWGGSGAGGKAGGATTPAAAFELRFILLQAREFEGVWPAEAVAGVLAHLDGGAGGAGAGAAVPPPPRGVAANA